MKKLLIALLLCVSSPAFAATCVISQYGEIVTDNAGREPQVAKEPGVADPLVVTFTDSSVASAILSNRATFVGIVCDAKAHYEFGTAPVAVAAENAWLTADIMQFFGLSSTGLKIAFIEGS